MIVTEKEAKEKMYCVDWLVCPDEHSSLKCIGSGCMAWKWHDPEGGVLEIRKGCCGKVYPIKEIPVRPKRKLIGYIRISPVAAHDGQGLIAYASNVYDQKDRFNTALRSDEQIIPIEFETE